MELIFDKNDIEELIDEEFDNEIITSKEKDQCLNDLKLGDYEVYNRSDDGFIVFEVNFEFANRTLSKYVSIDSLWGDQMIEYGFNTENVISVFKDRLKIANKGNKQISKKQLKMVLNEYARDLGVI